MAKSSIYTTPKGPQPPVKTTPGSAPVSTSSSGTVAAAPAAAPLTSTGSSVPYTPVARTSDPSDAGKTTGFLLLRLLLGLMLLLAGVEKFKSTDAPYSYSPLNWYDPGNPVGGRWLTVAKPVYEYGGFNNAEIFQINAFGERSGEKVSNFISHVFYYYAQTLPYLMIAGGVLILIGLFTRFALFLGGAIWLSLAAGQMTLPDNPTVFMLSQYVLMYALAASLVRYNRFAITRL